MFDLVEVAEFFLASCEENEKRVRCSAYHCKAAFSEPSFCAAALLRFKFFDFCFKLENHLKNFCDFNVRVGGSAVFIEVRTETSLFLGRRLFLDCLFWLKFTLTRDSLLEMDNLLLRLRWNRNQWLRCISPHPKVLSK